MRVRRSPGPASASSASLNAFILKSVAAHAGSARSTRSRNAATSSSRLRVSMKYSSTICAAVMGDGRGWRFMRIAPGKRPSRRLGPRLVGAARLNRLQDVDAADHQIGADVVDLERLADAPEQHDGQAAAEVLLELVEPAQHARR